jgi:hypothetical protein
MSARQKYQGAPWLYDETTGDIVGVKDPDGSEFYFQRAPRVGLFHHNATQVAASANTAYAMSLGETDISRGVSIVDTNKITVDRAGIYNIQFSTQLDRSNSGNDVVDIWFRKNGVNVPDSNTKVTISGGANAAKLVAAWNFFVEANAGDYFQIMWNTPDTNVRLHYDAAGTSPTRPITPSVIVTVNEVAA